MLQAEALLSKLDQTLFRNHEIHQAVLWSGGLEFVVDVSESLVFSDSYLSEIYLFATKSSSYLGQVVQAVVHHSS